MSGIHEMREQAVYLMVSAMLREKWATAGTDTPTQKARQDDNICRCMLRAKIRERLGINGPKARLTLIQGGKAVSP